MCLQILLPRHVLLNTGLVKLSSLDKDSYLFNSTAFKFNNITGINDSVYLKEDIKLISLQISLQLARNNIVVLSSLLKGLIKKEDYLLHSLTWFWSFLGLFI